MAQGIYVAENSRAAGRPRVVVIAESAKAAGDFAEAYWDTDRDAVNVGRLGDYVPGISGAAFIATGERPGLIVAIEDRA